MTHVSKDQRMLIYIPRLVMGKVKKGRRRCLDAVATEVVK